MYSLPLLPVPSIYIWWYIDGSNGRLYMQAHEYIRLYIHYTYMSNPHTQLRACEALLYLNLDWLISYSYKHGAWENRVNIQQNVWHVQNIRQGQATIILDAGRGVTPCSYLPFVLPPIESETQAISIQFNQKQALELEEIVPISINFFIHVLCYYRWIEIVNRWPTPTNLTGKWPTWLRHNLALAQHGPAVFSVSGGHFNTNNKHCYVGLWPTWPHL